MNQKPQYVRKVCNNVVYLEDSMVNNHGRNFLNLPCAFHPS